MASKHPLRRSCAFCRARKIRCSNETICEACRKQGADCIYDFESPRSRVRNPSIDSTKSNLLHVRSDHGLPDSKRRRSCSASSTPSTPPKNQEDQGPPGEAFESIAASLEQMFREKFPHKSVKFTPEEQSNSQSKPRPKDIRYTGLLSLLAYDLVGLVVDRFGSLGCYHNEENSSRFFRSGLASDNTQNMFDNLVQGTNPLSDYGPRQRTQLIDVWYSIHPLSFLISKTLLLREVRDGTCDEVLIAAMLAEASFVLGDEISVGRGRDLLKWAEAQLQNRRRHQQSSEDNSIHSNIPTRVYKRVTTAQALVLLAWNALSSYEFRRAVCYIDLASKMVTEIKECMARDMSPPNSSRINGVDVLDVEREVVTYLWWTTFSLNLWTCVQTGFLPESTPATFTLDSLPVTEASSIIIQLDLVSENFSTLQKQKGSMREMWPLAHISSTVAYLFLHTSDQAAARHGVGVCREAIRLLSGEANKAEEKCKAPFRRQSDDASRHLLLAFHHTMAAQFLFPKAFRDQATISPDTVDQFCTSMDQILRFLSLTPEQPCDPISITSSLHQSLPKALCLLLDTCSRAFNFIRANLGLSLNETYFHQGWDGRLHPLATRLYNMSKDDRFHQGSTLRAVRKQLKTCARAFGAAGASNSLGVPEANTNNMRSASHSPQHNVQAPGYFTATPQAIGDASSPFSCIEDISRVSSSMPSSSGSSASVSTPSFTPFEQMSKWPIDGGFSPDMLSTSTFSPPPAIQHGVTNGSVMSNMWYSQPPMMDLEPAGPVSIQLGQWVWPPTSSEEATYLSFQALDMEEAPE
ncbi:Zn(2)-C6 fungal-type domain-containing protein [Fusarium keratoplasticum]|uniref:Zn(2)-C6 fungal-type domain-containing protein n=1 Tax=Fusarium keratoplasticum TaxID=1328300 RepID=A0ACC0QZM4_9HYPO|nr:Zn(2)-C6 fungal-type domain-containing protein [Fusarium keratoplasticum]KAI8669102.1 Zn(2)-C6 fungal-type domain-containing protein [Fusarium keratoplasticum]